MKFEELIFENRTCAHPNRKKLTIQSGENIGTEIIVDVERADGFDANIHKEGTPINAELLTAIQTEIKDIKANQAAGGTVIKVATTPQTDINFTSDPQTQIDTKLNADFSEMESSDTLSNADLFSVQKQLDKTNKNLSFQNLYNAIKLKMFNDIYPIGSIYTSYNNNDPNNMFSGTTWAKIENKFLLASGSDYTLGSEGGEAAHKLEESEIPRHGHDLVDVHSWGPVGGPYSVSGNSIYGIPKTFLTDGSRILAVKMTGGGETHNNMPPYIVVNIWKRIS